MSGPLPLFPLGTVLVPTAVVPLHVFEPRYRRLMDDLIAGGEPGSSSAAPEFGVVLIERGSEVGGGDVSTSGVGTVARVVDARRAEDGRWAVAAVGTRRFRLNRWLPADPYPKAETTDIDEVGDWDPACDDVLAESVRLVRRTLGLAAELGESVASMAFDLDDDPLVASWQLCALAPVELVDRQALLETDDPGTRLSLLVRLTEPITAVLAYRLGGGR
jgi:hypothetical protein